ncbi:acyltransferase [Rhodocytophaga rosea]|uniref:Acyltransferase n=1 Tax=Rhodocytophaga rosea TaxID=2704465 RepID=A0A6C0GLC3_9BACT|nr:acyltransferase [Rhodocytophaga rosea]QHT68836.1 acyltransferase [Rhodocytophaga rosea]
MKYFFQDTNQDAASIREEILKYRSTFLMNDKERAIFLELPEGCRIRENAKIFAPSKFKCGTNVWIGEGAILDAQGGLEIGNFCQIGLYVMIWSHSSHKQALAGETTISRDKITYTPTKIGNNCFIAGHSVISAGVTIGNNVIIAPMSFVDRDLPDNSVFSNNRKMREMERKIDSLEKELMLIKAKL